MDFDKINDHCYWTHIHSYRRCIKDHLQLCSLQRMIFLDSWQILALHIIIVPNIKRFAALLRLLIVFWFEMCDNQNNWWYRSKQTNLASIDAFIFPTWHIITKILEFLLPFIGYRLNIGLHYQRIIWTITHFTIIQKYRVSSNYSIIHLETIEKLFYRH